ncbi:hypothetical protein MA16_Dca007007 [Dendrobium catenatum]|uniref:Uncharacterized protein n=1 Tax=Dendrobium catenatum TaxID=906689 RepID=A0A2I0VX36_9ASPA|nr:hypothetical protein MA16_Dca007007 [Dendrobium catenatum]
MSCWYLRPATVDEYQFDQRDDQSDTRDYQSDELTPKDLFHQQAQVQVLSPLPQYSSRRSGSLSMLKDEGSLPILGESERMKGSLPLLGECERMKDSLTTLGDCEWMKDSLPTLGDCERTEGFLPTLGECERMNGSLSTLGECERKKVSLPTLRECRRTMVLYHTGQCSVVLFKDATFSSVALMVVSFIYLELLLFWLPLFLGCVQMWNQPQKPKHHPGGRKTRRFSAVAKRAKIEFGIPPRRVGEREIEPWDVERKGGVYKSWRRSWWASRECELGFSHGFFDQITPELLQELRLVLWEALEEELFGAKRPSYSIALRKVKEISDSDGVIPYYYKSVFMDYDFDDSKQSYFTMPTDISGPQDQKAIETSSRLDRLGGKCSWHMTRSFSRAILDPHFLEADAQAAY